MPKKAYVVRQRLWEINESLTGLISTQEIMPIQDHHLEQ